MNTPLADRLRPEKLSEVVGQKHILGENKILSSIVESGNIPNMIFYGPSGTGKTTVANIIAKASNRTLYKLNATTASVADVKNICDDADSLMSQNGVLLYLDEIQNFNKKQQQSLLEYIENGFITLIAATTENPFFYVYNAILSRSNVFEFYKIPPEEICKVLLRGIDLLNNDFNSTISFDENALTAISEIAYGDVRKALNLLELCLLTALQNKKSTVTAKVVFENASFPASRYDRDGDSHYDLLSAFQKSIRGSDENAALHYLARLLTGGDLISVCRRLMVIAAEDIGLAYPTAISITKSCVDCALQLGLPEARIPLAEAVILLATAPKSNSAICAIDAAMEEIRAGDTGDIPPFLKDGHYAGAKKLGKAIGYKYPHSFPDHYVKQQYLPDKIKNAVYYNPGDNKFEQAAAEYMKKIKSK